jgi:hypothetical protein
MTIIDASVRQVESSNGTLSKSIRAVVDMTTTEWTNFLAASVPTPTNSVGTGAMAGITNLIAGQVG